LLRRHWNWFALALGACSTGSTTPPGSEARAGANARPASAPLRFTVEAPAAVQAGGVVLLRMRLGNTGPSPVTVYVDGAPAAPLYNFVVTGDNGRLVWQRFGPGGPTPAARVRHDLGPGTELVYEQAWDQRDMQGRRVPPGTYRVRALLPTQPFGELGSELAEVTVGGE